MIPPDEYVYDLHPKAGDYFQIGRKRCMEVGEVFEACDALWIVREETEDDIGIPCEPYVAPVNEKWKGKKVLMIGGQWDGAEVMYSGDIIQTEDADGSKDAKVYKFSESSGCYEPLFANRGSSITSLSNLMKPRDAKDSAYFNQFPNLTIQQIAFILLGVHKVSGLKWGGEVECVQLLKTTAGHLRPEHSTPRCARTMARLAALNWDEFRLCAQAYYEKQQSPGDG